MTGRILISGLVAALAMAGISGTSVAQTKPSNDQVPNAQSKSTRQSTPGTQSRNTAPRSQQQTAQAQFDPWHSKGHELDNISDKLNACMLHPPEAVKPCIDYAITHPK
jgi:TolA-binding protein